MMSTHFFSDTSVMLGRTMRHITRSPDTIITTTIMPIAFMLLFVYVFGGAIQTGSNNYVNYLLPGILLITIASGISYTAYRLFLDLQSGIFDRFNSMPIARSSVLWGHVLTSLVSNAISVVVVVLVALLMGFRSSAGVLAWLAVAGILLLFTLALTWIAVHRRACRRNPWTGRPPSRTRSSSCRSSARHSCPLPRCRVPCAPSRKTSRSPRSSTRSEPCSSSSRSETTSGSPSPGASASSSSPMRSPWWPTGAK